MVRRIVRVYREAFSGLPAAVWVISAVAFVNRAGTMVLPFLSLYVTRVLGYSKIQAGWVLAAFGAGSLAGSYLGGWASDRFGATRVMAWSLVGGGAGFLIVGRLRSLEALVLAVFLLSTISDAFRPAAMAALVDHAAVATRTRALALVRLTINLGMAIGPAAGGWLATRGYGWLFLGDAVTCWGAAALLLWAGRRWIHESPVVRPATGTSGSGSPWRDGPFLVFLALMLLLGSTFMQVFSTMPLYLREVYGLPEHRIGTLFSINALVIVALEMPLVRQMERRESLRVAGFGGLLIGLGFGLLPLGSTAGFAVLSVLVWTAGEMLALPFTNAAVAHRASPGRAGRYMGLYTMAFSLAFVVAPVAGTAVYEALGPETLWFGVGVAGVLLWAGFAGLSGPFRRRALPGREEP